MKYLLWFVGLASVVGGLVMFGVTVQTSSRLIGAEASTYWPLAFGWLLGGIMSAAIPLGIAEVLMRLEDMQARH